MRGAEVIYTSYYGRLRKLVEEGITPISVSRGKPGYFEGESIDSLAPTWQMLRMGKEDYNREYARILERNDAKHIAEEVIGPRDVALLCYERDPMDCHRRFIAAWLRDNGYPCEEWRPMTRQERAEKEALERGQLTLF